jgi:3-oxoacyl-[acyl-carrier-protein] synthase II
MKAPINRRVFVVGYGAATPLGRSFDESWKRAKNGETGVRTITRCQVDSLSRAVGEIPDWDPLTLPFVDKKEASNWNAMYVTLTMAVCKEALEHSRITMDQEIAPKTGCFIGSAVNGVDAFRAATESLRDGGPYKVSPFLLPNLCANLPSSKAGMLLGFTGPLFSPQGACASGNHAIGIAARMIRDGDIDFALAGGVDTCVLPEIVHGFENMNATIKLYPEDRAYRDPSQASRPFSIDRKGMVLSEGAGVLVLAAEEAVRAHGLFARAEVLGVGWTSDAYHFTSPNGETIVRAIREAIDDAGLQPADIHYVNAHGTSTPKGDKTEVECLKTVFGADLGRIPVSSNKSQLGHTLAAAGAIEAALSIEAMHNHVILPTINYLPDPEFDGVDFVPNQTRHHHYDTFLSNAFGFGGTNCCVVLRGE